MVWVFWGLLVGVVGGLLLLAVLARRRRSPFRPAGPSTIQVLRIVGRSFGELLWSTSHPFGRGGWRRQGLDPSRDYVRDLEDQLKDRCADGSKLC